MRCYLNGEKTPQDPICAELGDSKLTLDAPSTRVRLLWAFFRYYLFSGVLIRTGDSCRGKEEGVSKETKRGCNVIAASN